MPDAADAPPPDPLRPPEPKPGLVRRFLVLRFANSAAWQMEAVAVGWYVYALTDSAFDLGLIGLVQFLPFAGLALFAGHLLDRYPRRLIVGAALAVECLCSLTLTVMAISGRGSVGAVFVMVACAGAARAFDQPGMQSWLPALSPKRDFPKNAARNSLTSQSAVILGPALGGFLYVLGPQVPFACTAALRLVALLLARSLPAERIAAGEPLSWNVLLQGVRFIWRTEVVWGSASLDLFCVLFGGATALLPIFARDILGVGPAGLGLLRSAPAIGAFMTGVVLARRPPDKQAGPRMMVAVAIFGAATVVFGLSRNLPLSLVALAVVGASDMLSVVIRSTLVQVVSPNAIRGRVTSVGSLFTGASNQLGMFESGVTAAWWGPVGSVVFGGLATLAIVAIWVRRYPSLMRLNRLALVEPAVDTPREAVSGSANPV